MPNIPIDWTGVSWLYLILLLLFVFFLRFESETSLPLNACFWEPCWRHYCLQQASFSGRITRTTCRYRLRRRGPGKPAGTTKGLVV